MSYILINPTTKKSLCEKTFSSIEEALETIENTIKYLKSWIKKNKGLKSFKERIKIWSNCIIMEKKSIFAEYFKDSDIVFLHESQRLHKPKLSTILDKYDSQLKTNTVNKQLPKYGKC